MTIGPVKLEASDIQKFAPDLDDETAAEMIADAMALAELSAPCITKFDFAYPGAAKAILRGAILRWHESGTGAAQSESVTAGPFGKQVTFDNRQTRKGMFWPSELAELRKLCGASKRQAYSVDLAPDARSQPPVLPPLGDGEELL
ncbi:hypothetical protein RhoFasGS6_03923 [Rhodococcus fascians]|uniref:hypothetical protein n=1 Tax=Rhodococcoides fascians TaxID=1828 RepID=UPI0016B6FAAA|nr:hypothetical protein [Rhodococcus fascians]